MRFRIDCTKCETGQATHINIALVGSMWREGEIARSGQLQRIVFNDKWEEMRREPLLRELHQRIRDVRQGPDGLLYLLTEEDQAALLRIEPAAATVAGR